MQDLKTIIKPEYIEFEPHNLVTPWCVRDRHMALWAKHQQPRLYPEEMSLFSVLQDMPTHLRENAINIPIFYLPERNLLLITSNKAGMSSVNQMVQKMEKLTTFVKTGPGLRIRITHQAKFMTTGVSLPHQVQSRFALICSLIMNNQMLLHTLLLISRPSTRLSRFFIIRKRPLVK